MKKIFALLLIAIFTVTTFTASGVDAKTRGKKHVSGYHRNGKYVKPYKANRYYNSNSRKHKRKHK